MYDAAAKNLVFISRIIHVTNVNEQDENEDDQSNKNNLSLLWLLKKLRYWINQEISQAPTKTIIVSNAGIRNRTQCQNFKLCLCYIFM